MRVFGIEGAFGRLCKTPPQELSSKEFDRLRALTLFGEIRNARVVCETFGMGRATLYRWLKRFDPKDLTSLREESRRPRRVRKPLWSRELVEAVKALREEYPRWGKDKLAVLVRGQGQEGSVPKSSEAERGVERATTEGDFGQEEESQTLWGEEARGLCGSEAWGPGRGGYVGCSSFSGGDAEAIYSQRCGVAVGCAGGQISGDSDHGQSIYRDARTKDAF